MDQSRQSQPSSLLHGERIEDYCLGGFHPVHIGDTFKEGRYKAVRKLGHGAFSTVWLAQDIRYALPNRNGYL